jgi:uncharacterized membrane protein
MKQEVGALTDVEKTVLDSIKKDQLISENPEDIMDSKLSVGQRMADRIASFGGSWRFIIIFGIFIFIWMCVNIFIFTHKQFDPYPFILLNLILSCLAALQAPVIMMSQNRQEEKDRERSKHDYQVNLKAEMEIRMLDEKIDHLVMNQQQHLIEIQQIQIDMMQDILDKIDRK